MKMKNIKLKNEFKILINNYKHLKLIFKNTNNSLVKLICI